MTAISTIEKFLKIKKAPLSLMMTETQLMRGSTPLENVIVPRLMSLTQTIRMAY